MGFLSTVCRPFVNEVCCKSLLDDFNFRDRECVSLFISKGIGFGLIFFSSILKIPQLIQIIVHRSGKGLSTTSLFMEVISNVLSLSYHMQKKFPFSTYGETILILIQNLLISFFVVHFSPNYNPFVWNGFLLINSFLVFSVKREVMRDDVMKILWTICLPLSIAYKIPQIIHTYKEKSRGELSALSCFLTVLGSCGRVFTTLREINDYTVLLMYILNVALNGTILFQSIHYPKEKKPAVFD